MKLKCNRRDLVEAVSIVEKAVPVKSTSEIMEGIFLQTRENKFHLVGNNMDLGVIGKFISKQRYKKILICYKS